MVDHNHDRVKTIDREKIGDEVHGEVLERVGPFKSKGGDGWDHRIGEYLVCLAYCTARDIFSNIDREAWLPVILGEECNDVQMATMAALKRAVGGGSQVMAGHLRYVEAGLVVKAAIIKGLVFGF